jgi:glutaminyl-tRNA synthetase
MGAFIVKCNEVIYDESGNVIELLCTADFENSKERKVKGTIHWLSAEQCNFQEVSIMQYDRLFTVEEVGENYAEVLNKDSAKRIDGVKLEKSLENAKAGERFQFVRNGYFTPDSKNAGVWNSIVDLKSSFKPS